MTENDEILAIPLWINGHAYLTMAPAFFDVRDPCTGQIRRRTPLCGTDQALTAVASANAALPAWAALTVAARAALLAALAKALAGYAEHFAGLISEETGRDAASASTEVEQALHVLQAAAAGSPATGGSGVVAVVSDDRAPLLGPLQRAVPALLAGATVVVKPSPKAPSAAFALAELTARSAFPGGVFNILHGDLAAIEGLCSAAEVGLLLFAGDPALGSKVAAIATRHGKPFVD
ncbi:MAG: Succinate-semialdehyde dehydrogenase [NADP(+)] GabD [Candidatus Accumulibacter phosphatis]|uniref:Succinate-semialdehyde dehydrogenase [NADP(+)] GabD n=1 Tax=Candidatus Accumulibacter phosphatis TaxID=327160 RepID=A0A080LW00_9PROT|nr:aldehyde dehydrogenase family protein [Accumulibacter sp.]KFB72828.1 MAG: Succinate-semialdehyde dehydrogenase [NADP(+)] GabD [Candidatus Accumulibacter phosphatis]HRF11353.1 aldehyde dehydrogenase family protein [Candidatus Accumulibacter phosphatis]